jgi:hypothetical protein
MRFMLYFLSYFAFLGFECFSTELTIPNKARASKRRSACLTKALQKKNNLALQRFLPEFQRL